MTSPEPINIKWVNSIDEIPIDFFHLCFPRPLEGHWWYDTLEKSGLEDQFTFAYALIFKGGQPIGIAPTFLMDVPIELVAPPELVKLLKLIPLIGKFFPFLSYQRTIFIGSPCAEGGTVGLIPGASLLEVAPYLQDAVYKRAVELKAPMIVWKDFGKGDDIVLERLCQGHGMFKMVSYPGTELLLTPGGMDEYYSHLKSSRRHNLRKKLKRSKQLAKMDVEIVQHPSPEILDDIFKLFWQTYMKGNTKFERLTPKFFELMAQQDISRFVLLRNQDTKQLIAFMLCFQLEHRVINKFIGLDYSIAEDIYLYFRLWEAALEWVISIGATEFWSGQTGYRAKIDVGNSLIPLTNCCKHRNPIIHKIYAEISKTISWKTIDKDLEIYLKAHPEDDLSSMIV